MTLNISSIQNIKCTPCNFSGAMNSTQRVKQINTVFNVACNDNVYSGTFLDKNFSLGLTRGFKDNIVYGKVGDSPFAIKHHGALFNPKKLSGKIEGKPFELNIENNKFMTNMFGSIGEEPININISRNLKSNIIICNYKNKETKFEVKSKFTGYNFEGDDINLQVKSKSFNKLKITGKYKADKDLLPFIMDIVYQNKAKETLAMLMTM